MVRRRELRNLKFVCGILTFVMLLTLAGCTRKPRLPPAASRTGTTSATERQDSVFENVGAEVAYVPETKCAECHADIAREFAQHPMGNSLGPVAAVQQIEKFDIDSHAVFDAPPYRYEVRQSGSHLVHGRTLLGTIGTSSLIREEHEIAIVVGSGQRGRSYLINRDGFLFMSPLTWYPDKQIWDLSPGYEHNNLGFTRPVLADCLFCHSNRANSEPHTKNKYSQPIFTGHQIGCQRCHGPGELHVKHHEQGPRRRQRTPLRPRRTRVNQERRS